MTDSFFSFSSPWSGSSPHGVYITAPRDDNFGIFTRYEERMTVDGNGNVGIGTTDY